MRKTKTETIRDDKRPCELFTAIHQVSAPSSFYSTSAVLRRDVIALISDQTDKFDRVSLLLQTDPRDEAASRPSRCIQKLDAECDMVKLHCFDFLWIYRRPTVHPLEFEHKQATVVGQVLSVMSFDSNCELRPAVTKFF